VRGTKSQCVGFAKTRGGNKKRQDDLLRNFGFIIPTLFVFLAPFVFSLVMTKTITFVIKKQPNPDTFLQSGENPGLLTDAGWGLVSSYSHFSASNFISGNTDLISPANELLSDFLILDENTNLISELDILMNFNS